MNSLYSYRIIAILFFWITFASCEAGPQVESKEEILLPQNERIQIPGVRYDEVYLYSQSLLSEEGTVFDQFGTGFDEKWEKSSLEYIEAGTRLYPAHHADLNVALWYQIQGDATTSNTFAPFLTFVYYHQGDRVGGIIVDIYERIVWPQGRQPVYLSTQGMNRIRGIMHELNDPANQR